MAAKPRPQNENGRADNRSWTGGRRDPVRSRLAIRSVAILTILVFSYASLRRTIAWSLRQNHIDIAYRIAPDDARIAAAWASATYDFGEAVSARKQALDAARSALSRDPTAVQAISTLALDAEAHGDRTRALALAGLAQTLSRRDLRTQLFLLQAAVEANDIKAALKHYDYVLRTSDQGPALLFPVLRKAVAFPDVRVALVETLARRPPWGGLYLYDLSANGPDYTAAGSLIADLRHAGIEVPPEVEDNLITHLVERGRIMEAWKHYQARFPDARRDNVRDGGFGTQASSTPFDWIFPAGAGAVAELVEQSGLRGLNYEAPAEVGGVAVRQLLVLPEGKYHLVGSAIVSAADDATVPVWHLRCNDGRVIADVRLPRDAADDHNFAADLSIPKACPAQWLELVVPPSEAIGGNRGSLHNLAINRVGR